MNKRTIRKTAIIVDGGFYRKRAYYLWGEKSAKDRADELFSYCLRHISEAPNEDPRDLYRIFYYDCPPMKRKHTHPLTGIEYDFYNSPIYCWTNIFFKELLKKRKLALRRGELAEGQAYYALKKDVLPFILSGEKPIDTLLESDFIIDVKQKGVDLRIGLDIASLAYEKLVNQIIIIAGDSDFIPAAKLARRSGIDFILDPMKQHVQQNLLEHVDGIESFT